MSTPTRPEPVVELVEDTEQPAGAEELLPTIEFHGQRFAVREHVSLLPMMKFATIAKRQAQQQRTRPDPAEQGRQEMEALAALYELLQQCIAPEEFDAFYEHALTVGAEQTDLMGVVRDSVAASAAGRPTRRSSPSPGGPQTTAPSSAAGSSSPAWSVPQGSEEVQRDLEARGRPDMALVVMRAREASTRSSAG
jgi:hypothetical protein